ncbi:MAG: hypothetical protein ABI720_05920 [Actinomycetes bacterium]
MTASDDERAAPPTSSEWARLVGSQRHDQYTPIGEITMFGDFATGVHLARGWKLWLGLAVALLILASLLGVIWSLAALVLARV